MFSFHIYYSVRSVSKILKNRSTTLALVLSSLWARKVQIWSVHVFKRSGKTRGHIVTTAMDALKQEREAPKFDKEKLSCMIYGSPEELERVRRLSRIIAEDPVFNREDDIYASREQFFDLALKRSQRIIQIIGNFSSFLLTLQIMARLNRIAMPHNSFSMQCVHTFFYYQSFWDSWERSLHFNAIRRGSFAHWS